MPGKKLFINHTRHELRVILTIRKGEDPAATAGTQDFTLAAGPDAVTGEDLSQQEITYGSATDIYLNGIETQLITDGAAVGKRDLVVRRGSPMDDQLNTHSIVDFLFDGEQVLISASNPNPTSYAFRSNPPSTS
jgi:hypothetical protein